MRNGRRSCFEAPVAIADGELTVDARDTFAECGSVRTNGSKSEGVVVMTVGEAAKETWVWSGPSNDAGSNHSMSLCVVKMSLGGEV